jgi:hypothetical protein
MDWPGWKAALELWLKTPELIAGTILLLLAVGGLTARLAWKYRDHTVLAETRSDSLCLVERSGFGVRCC